MVIFNEAKPKYEKLDELLEEYIQDIRLSNQVNIIIDLKEILKKFFRPDVTSDNFSHRALIEEISSDIINTVGHYRNYFYKKGKYTNFYFLYSYEKCEKLIAENPNYKKDYYEKYFDPNDEKVDIIKRSVQVIEKISAVTPHTYFINTSKYDEFIYAKYIKSTINDNELILILSNDDIFLQLLDKRTIQLNIKGIKSSILTNKNAINILTKKDEYRFSSNLIPLVLALGGHKKYSIEGVSSVAMIKACNIVNTLLEREIVTDVDSIEIPIQFSKLDLKNKMEKMIYDNKDEIISRYQLIRSDEMLYSNKLIIASDFIFNKKIGSVNYFKDLNSKIFSQFPLQIEMILKGEKLWHREISYFIF